MKVLLTGATGFLGPHIIKKLTDEDASIVALVRPTSETSHLRSDRIKLITADLRDEKAIQEALEGVDVVIHAATSKGGAWQDYEDVNVKSTELLLKNCVGRKIKRFVFISSVIVYDHSTVENETIFTEESVFASKQFTNYSKSKIQAEKLVAEYHEKYKIPSVVIRPAGLYGPGGLLHPARLGFAAGVNKYVVVDKGQTRLPLTHVESVSQVIMLSIKKAKAVGKSYNIVDEDHITQREFLSILKEILNPKLRIINMPFKVGKVLEVVSGKLLGLLGKKGPIRPQYLEMCSTNLGYSSEKAKTELGWKPCSDVRESVKEMMLWHKQKRTPARNFVIPKNYNTDRVIKIGIVGCGMFAETHLSILKKVKNVKVVALCDVSEDASKRLAEKYKVSKTYTKIEDMLSKEKIEAVHILTSAQTHAKLAITAMKKGCHVLVEKPMAIDSTDAKKMIAEAKKNNVKLSIDHSHLYKQEMFRVRGMLAAGTIGKVVQVDGWFGTAYSSNTGNRYLTYEAKDHWVYKLPGGLFQNMISHPISVVMDIVGMDWSVNAKAGYAKIVPHQSVDELRVLFKSGEIIGSLCLSLAVSPRHDFINIYGTRGTLKVDFTTRCVVVEKVMPLIPKVISRNLMSIKTSGTLLASTLKNAFDIIRGKYSQFDGVENLIRLFYLGLLEDKPMPVSAEEGLKSMEIMDKIWEQIHLNGEEVLQNGNGVVEQAEGVTLELP